MRFSSSSLLRCSTVASLVLCASAASAHIGLSKPVARAQAPSQGNVKSAPCGQTADGRTSGVTVFQPGAVVTVNWVEYVNHPSYFRVAFQPDGDSFPMRQNVPQSDTVPETAAEQLSAEQAVFAGSTAQLLAVVQDNNTSTTAQLSTQVTLPNVSCDNCTLQVVQVMYNNPPQDGGGYYQCADITIQGDGDTTAGDPSGSAGAAGAANSGTAGSASIADGGAAGTAATASAGATAAATGGAGGSGSGGPAGSSTPSTAVGAASTMSGTTPLAGTAMGTNNANSASPGTTGLGTSAAPSTAGESSDDEGGCSFEAPSGARSWALWGLAPAALIFARRLRRRSARR